MSAEPDNAPRTVVSLSRAGAERVVAAVVATRESLPVSVAVHEAGANLLAFLRTDGAPELTIGITQNKFVINGQIAGSVGVRGGHHSREMAIAESAIKAAGRD